MVIDLLQRVGFNKYEAEAYAALLEHGPLTGYELGKRSGVPLSRSYEILERLTSKGLALVQPGDPPRYIAEAPRQLLDRTRAEATATLDALAGALAELEQARIPDGFWVVRGRDHILAHAKTLIGQARHTLSVSIAQAQIADVEPALGQARMRGCRILQAPIDARAEAVATVLLVADEREGMVGTLTPAERCQAVSSANPGFIAVVGRFFAPQPVFAPGRTAEAAVTTPRTPPLDWLDWEERKQRRLLDVQPGNRIA